MPPSYDAGGSRSSLYYARLSKSCELVASPAIHHVTEWTAGDVAGEIRVEGRRQLLGHIGPGDVWRHDDVVERPQRVDRRQRLDGEDVEHGAADAPGAERVHQGRFVHQRAAADVDEPRAGLHGGEL